jgi:hypothetical protein
MIILPASRSLLLRATHVVQLVLLAVRSGGWERAAEGMSRREVELRVRIEQIFKGKAAAGEERVLHVVQHRGDSMIYMPVPGAWSEAKLEQGQVFVVLGSGPSLEAALASPHQLLPAESAPEVRLAAEAEQHRWPLAQVVQKATPLAGELGIVFADWIWVRHGERALTDAASAEALFSLLELPALNGVARSTLAGAAVTRASAAPLAYAAGARRLALALFRLLAMPAGEGLNDNSVSTYLPALLHLRGGSVVPKGTLFSEEDAAEAKRALAAYKGASSTAPLQAWLDGP